LEAAASHGLVGAIIYDALLIACARKAEAKWIFTNNHKHFRRIAPDLASRIIEP
jgi:predicted nucleic acid-binding protein